MPFPWGKKKKGYRRFVWKTRTTLRNMKKKKKREPRRTLGREKKKQNVHPESEKKRESLGKGGGQAYYIEGMAANKDSCGEIYKREQ